MAYDLYPTPIPRHAIAATSHSQAETDRDVAYGWLLRRSPQLLARGRAHCCSVLDAALAASRKNAASAIARGGAAVASLREHCARYRQAREAMLERTIRCFSKRT